MNREIIAKVMQLTARIQNFKTTSMSSYGYMTLRDVVSNYGFTTGNRIYGEDDGADTDLIHLSLGDDDVTIAVWANVSPDNNEYVQYVDLSNVDIIVEGELYDCISLE